MSKPMTFPVGSKVSIVRRKNKPSNWNHEMMGMGGKVAYIISTGPMTAYNDDSYHYKLDISLWVWRHIDLKLIELGKADPNLIFRSKKLGY